MTTRNPDTNRQITFLGPTHRRLILGGRVDVPQGYFVTPTRRVLEPSARLVREYARRYPDYVFNRFSKRYMSPQEVHREFASHLGDLVAEPNRTPTTFRTENIYTNPQGTRFGGISFFYDRNVPLESYFRSLKRSLGRNWNQYQFSIILSENFEGEFRTFWSTRFDTWEYVLDVFETHMLRVEGNYDGENDRLDYISIKWRLVNPENGQGGRSIEVANRVWKIVSPNTTLNCLYHAFIIARDYTPANQGKIDNIVDKAKKIKKRCADRYSVTNGVGESAYEGGLPKMFSNRKCVEALAVYTKSRIVLYNNCFAKVEDYNFGDKVIEIQISNNHYRALLRWRDIHEHAPEVMSQIIPQEEKLMEIIDKRKYPKPYNTKIMAWDMETSNGGMCYNCGHECPDSHCRTCSRNQYVMDIEGKPIRRGGIHKSYMVGCAWYKEGGKEQEYMAFRGMDCLTRFMDFLWDNRVIFNGYTLYAHNGGKFDLPILMRECLDKYEKFQIMPNAIELNNALIHLEIVSTGGRERIIFKDSLRLFGPKSALAKLCKDFKVQHQKLAETVNHDMITIQNWHTFPELDLYLKHDCLGLLEILDIFSRNVWNDTQFSAYVKKDKTKPFEKVTGGINITDCNTGASLSKKTWFNCYYDKDQYPVCTLSPEFDSEIRDCYYGGRVELFTLGLLPTGPKYYLDFTSLFPSTSKLDLPYGIPFKHVFPEGTTRLEKKHFGFVRCRVRSVNTGRKPLHGIKKDFKLLFPDFTEWREMMLFSEEIKLGMREGLYEYEMLHIIQFKRGKFMSKFIDEMFSKKENATREKQKALAQSYKIIINSSYGFWGLRTQDRDSVVIGNTGDVDESVGKLKSESVHGRYTIRRVEKDLEITDFNVSVAASISSYARMKLWCLIDDIEKVGKHVYMCDTDSVITDCKLIDYPELMKKYMWDGCGEALGALKNECDDFIKDNFKTIDIERQREIDGGMLHFDEVCLNGAKFYSAQKTCYTGEVHDISKCKGYKQTSDDRLTFSDMVRLDDLEEHLEQKQLQFQFGKANMVSETDFCAVRTDHVIKKFKRVYNKGIIGADGTITPIQLC